MNFKKMLNNPWLILGGAVAVYWFWFRPKSAAAGVVTQATPQSAGAATQARVNAAIAQVTEPRPGESVQEYESRLRAYELQTGQVMPTMF
ncbi:MAG TPA: hypothetical protein VM221_10130 [Armatimonadota bacterium]|nr:hypothetical protein [Armatimonadota bacterium]